MRSTHAQLIRSNDGEQLVHKMEAAAEAKSPSVRNLNERELAGIVGGFHGILLDAHDFSDEQRKGV